MSEAAAAAVAASVASLGETPEDLCLSKYISCRLTEQQQQNHSGVAQVGASVDGFTYAARKSPTGSQRTLR